MLLSDFLRDFFWGIWFILYFNDFHFFVLLSRFYLRLTDFLQD